MSNTISHVMFSHMRSEPPFFPAKIFQCTCCIFDVPKMAQFQAGFQPLVIFEGSGVQFLRDNLENCKRSTLTNDS